MQVQSSADLVFQCSERITESRTCRQACGLARTQKETGLKSARLDRFKPFKVLSSNGPIPQSCSSATGSSLHFDTTLFSHPCKHEREATRSSSNLISIRTKCSTQSRFSGQNRPGSVHFTVGTRFWGEQEPVSVGCPALTAAAALHKTHNTRRGEKNRADTHQRSVFV